MSEFDLIRRLQETVGPGPGGSSTCVLGIGDDAAVLECDAGRQLVVCTDTLVEGVHFPEDTVAQAVGHKALAVNLSDLAAMGADPAWFLMALTLPAADQGWLDAFARGTAELATSAGIELIGGDVTSGPRSVCVTALGHVEPGTALTRGGAASGDLIAVSGHIGAAAAAVQALRDGRQPTPDDRRALDYPSPRLALGRVLRGVASACIDLSDGLLADLGHILEQSGGGARIELARLPTPPSLAGLADSERWMLQLAGGDDYELCFTLPAERSTQLEAIARSCGVAVTVIGTVTATPGIVLVDERGEHFKPAHAGYEHFGWTGSG